MWYTTYMSIPEHDPAVPIVRRVLEEEIRPRKSHVKVTGSGRIYIGPTLHWLPTRVRGTSI